MSDLPRNPDSAPDGALAGRSVLLGVSGGIAAYKAASLARVLLKAGATVQVVMTAAATKFVGPATFEGLTGRPAYSDVFTDVEQIPHVRLAREADVAVFAPATANLIAKFAVGLADDMVSSVYTCLTCPVVIAPAMHTEMWLHAATQANVATLLQRGVQVVGPDEGELAGGDVGPGRLVDEQVLLDAVVAADARVRDVAQAGSGELEALEAKARENAQRTIAAEEAEQAETAELNALLARQTEALASASARVVALVEEQRRQAAEAAARYDDGDGTPLAPYRSDHPGSGDVYASAHDMLRFGMFHLGTLRTARPVLRPATVRAMSASWVVVAATSIRPAEALPGLSSPQPARRVARTRSTRERRNMKRHDTETRSHLGASRRYHAPV
ncbi:MAG: hypothetical protein KY433_12945 [Actinobacteria bacterium]|nr:hypothetical protein [Actinomycetota bacterium]